jgi:flagellin-like hook-associated protein FlgL
VQEDAPTADAAGAAARHLEALRKRIGGVA